MWAARACERLHMEFFAKRQAAPFHMHSLVNEMMLQ